MSTPAAAAEWTIIYHTGYKLKGRGEFLRLLLEDSNISYDTVGGPDIYGPTGLMDCFRGSPEAVDTILEADKLPFPLFYPPAIWHRPTNGDEPVVINQVGACVRYIGSKLGYDPKTPAERARADCITENAIDYITEGRRCFHPVEDNMSYKEQKDEGDKKSLEFTQKRMKLFLHHFNKLVVMNGSPTKPIAGGTDVTYADFTLFHVLDATVSQFNSDYYEHAWDNTNVPQLKEYYNWMKNRPNLQEYFASDRCNPFAGDSMM